MNVEAMVKFLVSNERKSSAIKLRLSTVIITKEKVNVINFNHIR